MVTASQTTSAALGAAQPIKKLNSTRVARVPLESSSSRRSRVRARGGNLRKGSASILNSSAQPTATVEVDLGDRSYPIYIGSSLLDNGELIRRHVPGNTALVVTNETIAPLYLDRTVAALSEGGNIRVEVVILPDGEEHKNMDVLMKVFDKALEAKLDRQTTFVALGGGVIGDMTGYAASSYQRGVHFIQIPTTVMAMVDSSVGGKTGVNHPAGKNMIGAFYQPRCVMIDTDTLATLPDREYASGMAEVVKYGLIRDAEFFQWQESNVDALMSRKEEAVVYAIERSCVNKAEVVALDEKEGGVRATLNLGHTFGHAIETGIGYGEWLHGEAVSVGMLMAAHMSERLGWMDKSILDRTFALLNKFALPVEVPDCMTTQIFEDLMAVDKKAANGKLRLILLKGDLGSCVFTADFDKQTLSETLKAFVK